MRWRRGRTLATGRHGSCAAAVAARASNLPFKSRSRRFKRRPSGPPQPGVAILQFAAISPARYGRKGTNWLRGTGTPLSRPARNGCPTAHPHTRPLAMRSLRRARTHGRPHTCPTALLTDPQEAPRHGARRGDLGAPRMTRGGCLRHDLPRPLPLDTTAALAAGSI